MDATKFNDEYYTISEISGDVKLSKINEGSLEAFDNCPNLINELSKPINNIDGS